MFFFFFYFSITFQVPKRISGEHKSTKKKYPIRMSNTSLVLFIKQLTTCSTGSIIDLSLPEKPDFKNTRVVL